MAEDSLKDFQTLGDNELMETFLPILEMSA